jgi:hypothetical protein
MAMRNDMRVVFLMSGLLLAGLASCRETAPPPAPAPREAAAEQVNVADGVLPGGNLLACETYSLRELFKEQKPDPKKPWVGKYPLLDLNSYPAFIKELGIKGVAINDWYLGSFDAPDFEQNLDKVKEACKASDRVIVALITGGPMALADEPKRLAGLKAVEKKLRVASRAD